MHDLRSTVLRLPPRLSRRQVLLVGRVGSLPVSVQVRLHLGHGEAIRLLRRLECGGGIGAAIYGAVMQLRLAIVVDGCGRVLMIRRRRGAREGCGRLCVEVCCSVLIEILELVALIMVKGVLSKACVSTGGLQSAGSGTGQRDKGGLEKKTVPCTIQVHGEDSKETFYRGLTGGEVLLKSSEPAELECEGVRGVMPKGNWWYGAGC